MLKDNMANKICYCKSPNNKEILKKNINHSFCDKCGCILIKSNNGRIYYTLKPKQKIKPNDLNPIEIIKSMKKKTEKDYPYLNNEYYMDDIKKYNKESFMKSINLYLKQRKMIILVLQKMMKMLDFSDLIFYQCLFYIDFYLSQNMTEDMSEKKILYYLVGYFLCSAKLKETDIYEPNLDSFCCLKKKIYLSIDKIAYYEIVCLKSIKYNIFSYSAYDWLTELISIGFVFDCEVNKNNEIILINGHRHSIINTISKYALKMLLNITVKNIFIKFSPMYIAFSLMQIAREKYLDKNVINIKLFNYLINLYGVNFNDYKKCYKELKAEIEQKQIEIKGTNDILETEKNMENEPKNENKDFFDIEKLKKGSQGDATEKHNHCKMDKNVLVSNKMKSSNAILRLRESLLEPKEEIEKDKNKDKEPINNEKNNHDNNIEDNSDQKDENEKKNKNEINTSKDENNIIVFEENNDDKNNMDIEYKFNVESKDDASEEKDNTNKNKLRSSLELSHIKPKNHLFINCNNQYRSNENLPKINPLFNQDHQSQLNTEKNKKDEKHLKCSSSKEIANKFLKTNQKTLNPVRNRRTMSNTNHKKYSINISNYTNNNIDNNGIKPKEDLDSMRKSLFYGNSNKKLNSNEAIIDLKKSNNNKKLSNNDNKQNEKNSQQQNTKRLVCKSKGKSINNLEGKETKAYIPNKRNQSTNQVKKRFFKSTLDANNAKTNKNNLQWKNN